jgi:O-methyltransferase
MKPNDFAELTEDIKKELAKDPARTFAILGHLPDSYELVAVFRQLGAEKRLLGVYAQNAGSGILAMSRLKQDQPNVVVVAGDETKEDILEQAVPYLSPVTKVLFGGYAHFEFRDQIFQEVNQTAFVTSLANGYPYTVVHMYQVLANAARLGRNGVVVEFGMFKGGTTLILSRLIERLGQKWPVIGFDTFGGFPAKRSLLDMYAHPDCVFRDDAIVRRSVEGRNIEIVKGDIVKTVKRLAKEDVLLAFLDTDNYTSAKAVLDVIRDRVVVGGAIVFDHFTGRNRHRYTLGERIAGKALLEDKRYFHLHDTGVFMRQV